VKERLVGYWLKSPEQHFDLYTWEGEFPDRPLFLGLWTPNGETIERNSDP